jgi:hypothetical protein
MRKIIPFLALVALLSCSNSNNSEANLIINSKWKLIETYFSDGGSDTKWIKVDNGYTIEFYQNGTFKSMKPGAPCVNGKYSISDKNILVLKYNCNTAFSDFETIESYSTNATTIILTSKLCDDACLDKFEKVN